MPTAQELASHLEVRHRDSFRVETSEDHPMPHVSQVSMDSLVKMHDVLHTVGESDHAASELDP